jgi:tetraacyldisaccharide-1-P 4'-kinase
VTTQKDAVNLCEAARELVAPLPLYWLEIAMKIDREEESLRAVERILESAPAGR